MTNVIESGVTNSAGLVAEVAQACAVAADRSREPHPDVVDAVMDAGFGRHHVPAAFGGFEGGFEELAKAVVQVGRGDASAAWFASLCAAVGRMSAFLPAPGQDDIWSSKQDPVIVGALTPSGTAVRSPGGWSVKGRWPYVSGVTVSDWALVCARDVAGADQISNLICAVPRAAFEVVDSWSTVGMRGSGSHSLALEEVVVPPHRVFAMQSLVEGKESGGLYPTCYQAPMKAVNGITLASPAIGAALSALNSWSSVISSKLTPPAAKPSEGSATNRSDYDLTYARAAAEVDVAELLVMRAARVADRGSVDGEIIARSQRDTAFSVETLSYAIDRLFRSAGSSGQFEEGGLARKWRDIGAIAGHSGLRFSAAAASYGQIKISI